VGSVELDNIDFWFKNLYLRSAAMGASVEEDKPDLSRPLFDI